jgi:imidazolonepropionase-like amidohydrolase
VRAVRHQASHGADWIKVYADYRTGPNGETRPTFSEDELRALVDTAHDTRDAPSPPMPRATKACAARLVAGVDTIEHGYGGSDATFALMAKKGVAFLPTLTAPEAIGEYFLGYVARARPNPPRRCDSPSRAFAPR